MDLSRENDCAVECDLDTLFELKGCVRWNRFAFNVVFT